MEGLIFAIRPENRFALDPDFVADHAGRQPAWGPVGYVTYRRTYSRRLTPAQRERRARLGLAARDASTEEFWETATRVVEGTFSILQQQIRTAHQPWDAAEAQDKAREMYRRMWAFKFLPPGRGLWFMGTEALQKIGSASLNNCGFVSTENVDLNFSEPFTMLMDYLMLGVGMGFDVLGAGRVTVETPNVASGWTFVVPDSREGWVESLRLTLDAFVGKGSLPGRFDFSELRPEGAPLLTFGGTSSGPQPLVELLADTRARLVAATGAPVSATLITDIMNLIGRCVVAGNIRRSSEIALGQPDDAEFINLKDPSGLLDLQRRQRERVERLGTWRDLQARRDEMARHRDVLGIGVLDPRYVLLQQDDAALKDEQQRVALADDVYAALQAEVNAHPLRTHRWASNNTVLCLRGQDYAPLAHQTVTNGEPGYAWPEVFKRYGRLVDPPNDKDRKAKGFNPCVAAGTRILTRNGYIEIETLVGKTVDVWNGETWAPVEPRVTGHDEPMMQVLLSNGVALTCTEYHQWILAPRRRNDEELRVLTRELQPGDALAAYDMPVVETGTDWDQAYTHGFFCGDGQVSVSGAKGVLLYGEKKQLLPHLVGATPGNHDAYDRQYVGLPRALPEKFSVPMDRSIAARVAWLSGLLDADGCVVRQANSVAIQLSNIELGFLNEVRLMLTTLSVQAKVTHERTAQTRMLPDGKGGVKAYECQANYRLLLNATDTYRLLQLGLHTHRLDIPALKPQRDARRFVRVVSIERMGVADTVYCFTEASSKRGCFQGVITGQCGEQTLWDRELCCLCETFPTNHADLDDYLQTLKYAYLYAKVVTLVPTHNPATNAVMTRNRRIGTSMAGVVEMYAKLGMPECIRWWDAGYRFIKELDAEYSGWMGVGESIKVTSVKPGGTVPLLTGVEGGMKAPISRFYMRTIRIEYTSPLVDALKAAGYRVEPDLTTPRTVVAYFPVEETRCARTAADIGLWEQALLFTNLQRHWADNMVSATLTFKPEEAKDLANLLSAYEGQWKCVTFLPLSDHGFAQAPYIPCTEAEYRAAVAGLKPLALDGVGHEDDEKYCSGDVCVVPPPRVAVG